ncbi:MAG TPA: hypothetical protein DCM40_02225 [Maribacter sp.]|jgi:hypothetical protein|nr:hypothetical protein [Maribacter sp.]|tara:strand:- start:191 stop:385 length:195 start_codon:yes stop_codon:yes gene_type:complete
MNDIDFLDKLKKLLEDRERQVQETLMSGGLKDMEHYKYLQGELSALYYITNGIGDMLKKSDNNE